MCWLSAVAVVAVRAMPLVVVVAAAEAGCLSRRESICRLALTRLSLPLVALVMR